MVVDEAKGAELGPVAGAEPFAGIAAAAEPDCPMVGEDELEAAKALLDRHEEDRLRRSRPIGCGLKRLTLDSIANVARMRT